MRTGAADASHSPLIRAGAASVFFIFAAAFPAFAQTPPQTLDYSVAIQGIETGELRELLRAVSDLVQKQDQPPATLWLLERQARADAEAMTEALHSRGYYAGSASVEVRDDLEPVDVVFTVDAGPRYTVEQAAVEAAEGADPETVPEFTPEALGLPLGSPADARRILAAESVIKTTLRNKGRPYPEVADRRVVVDHGSRTARITYRVAPGQQAHFGPVAVEGLEDVREQYVLRRIPWEPGQEYDPVLLRELRTRLVKSGLFTMVQVDPAEELTEEGALPVVVELAERPHRTLAAGIGFRTDEGVGVRGSWEHRNLTGRGDRLTLEARYSSISAMLSGSYRIPDWRRLQQNLTLQGKAASEEVDAYVSRYTDWSAIVDRQITERMFASAGVRIKSARVDPEEEEDQRYGTLSLPLQFSYDTRDDEADPGDGGFLSTRLEPYAGVGDAASFFAKGSISYSRYVRISEAFVLAGRAAVGTIQGAERAEVPADERFYAGGANSVRGYSYRSLSPLEDDAPLGGRSMIEISIEARQRLTDTIGLAYFLDGGNAYDEVYPSFSETLRWGAGVGVRFFTPAGPFRVDLAIPINKRDIDDSWQIYASFGQAF